MKPYKVIRTDTADAMLARIVLFIAKNFDTDIALARLDEIEDQIKLLALNPEMGVRPRYAVLRRQGYHVLILKKDLVFYKIGDENRTITIHAFFDSREDYLDVLQGL